MAALTPCLACGRLNRGRSYCPRHEPHSPPSPGRGSGGKAATFRRRTLAKTDGACAICGSTDRVEAHHVLPLSRGGSNAESNGEARCHRHHPRGVRSF